jgi:DNA modification methylase
VMNEWTSPDGRIRLINADCLAVSAGLDFDCVITDPPYGMGKGEWDSEIPNWLSLVRGKPTATFCGVVGMRDYPTPDWTGAWVREASTQRNGRLRGFNNWEPILFYNITSLANDVIRVPNIHPDTGHPTTKPVKLMERLIERMPLGTILDPFAGSCTTAIACIRTNRRCIAIEKERKYFEIGKQRCKDEYARTVLFNEAEAVA